MGFVLGVLYMARWCVCCVVSGVGGHGVVNVDLTMVFFFLPPKKENNLRQGRKTRSAAEPWEVSLSISFW